MRLSFGTQRPIQKSLFDRLGGIYPIAAVVDRFSDALINNPVVGRMSANPALRDWHRHSLDRLPGLKFMRTMWISAVAGGPFKKPDLMEAHSRFNITSEEFDEVAQVLKSTMIEMDVPAYEQAEIMDAFISHKCYVVSRGLAPRPTFPPEE